MSRLSTLMHHHLLGTRRQIGSAKARLLLRSVGRASQIDMGVKYVAPDAIVFGHGVQVQTGCTFDGRSTSEVGIRIGDGSRLKENVWLASYGGKIEIGPSVLIGRNCVIAGHGDATIGEGSMIGNNTSIHSSDHVYWEDGCPIQAQGFTREEVSIGANVWIGANCVILAGVTIGPRVVVGAGSVVTKNLESGYLYVGNPAAKKGQLSAYTKDVERYYRVPF